MLASDETDSDCNRLVPLHGLILVKKAKPDDKPCPTSPQMASYGLPGWSYNLSGRAKEKRALREQPC